MRKSGFGLIELIVGVTIIGTLATLGIATYSRTKMQARDANRRTSVRGYTTSLDQWKVSKGNYFVERPKTSEGECRAGTPFYDGSVPTPHIAGFRGAGDACVGFLGGSVGQMTRTDSKGLINYRKGSIAQALVEQGYLEKIATDPLDREYGTKSDRDFILTLCSTDSTAAKNKAEAVQFAVYANLEEPKQTEASTSKVHCGGSSTPFGWDTLVYTK